MHRYRITLGLPCFDTPLLTFTVRADSTMEAFRAAKHRKAGALRGYTIDSIVRET